MGLDRLGEQLELEDYVDFSYSVYTVNSMIEIELIGVGTPYAFKAARTV